MAASDLELKPKKPKKKTKKDIKGIWQSQKTSDAGSMTASCYIIFNFPVRTELGVVWILENYLSYHIEF